MVIFGAGGDLTGRLVIPALYNLGCARLLPENFALLGFDLADKNDDSWRESLQAMTEEFVKSSHGGELNRDVWDWIEARMCYVRGDLNDPQSYAQLKTKLEEID